MVIRTTFRFTLPRGTGIKTEAGRKVSGSMRLIKIKDLIQIERDGEVQRNTGAFYVVLLSKVITEMGQEGLITRKTIEKLDPMDFAFLIDLLHNANHQVIRQIPITCPQCSYTCLGEYTQLGEV